MSSLARKSFYFNSRCFWLICYITVAISVQTSHLASKRILVIKIRWSHSFIFIMGIPIPEKTVLYWNGTQSYLPILSAYHLTVSMVWLISNSKSSSLLSYCGHHWDCMGITGLEIITPLDINEPFITWSSDGKEGRMLWIKHVLLHSYKLIISHITMSLDVCWNESFCLPISVRYWTFIVSEWDL